jgi:hypothetical protein
MPFDTTTQRNFTFTRRDRVVTKLLTADEIESCPRWQEFTDAYTFEFHPMHTTGYPIYFRPVDNEDSSNIPKIDTKNIADGGAKYHTVKQIANPRKLTDALNQKQIDDILNIIKDSWATLKIMAERYWTKTDPPKTAARSEMQCEKCNKSFFDQDLGNANKFGKYKCPKCDKFTVKPV